MASPTYPQVTLETFRSLPHRIELTIDGEPHYGHRPALALGHIDLSQVVQLAQIASDATLESNRPLIWYVGLTNPPKFIEGKEMRAVQAAAMEVHRQATRLLAPLGDAVKSRHAEILLSRAGENNFDDVPHFENTNLKVDDDGNLEEDRIQLLSGLPLNSLTAGDNTVVPVDAVGVPLGQLDELWAEAVRATAHEPHAEGLLLALGYTSTIHWSPDLTVLPATDIRGLYREVITLKPVAA